MKRTMEMNEGGVAALDSHTGFESRQIVSSKSSSIARVEKRLRAHHSQQDHRSREIRVQLRTLLRKMTHEAADNFSSWTESFLAILDKADTSIYQENKSFFHQALDFFINPPKEVKGEIYLPFQKELGLRIRPFDTLKATSITWKYTYCSQRIPGLIQEAREALRNGKKEGALIWLERAKELVPYHQGGLAALNRQYEEERCTYIVTIAELEGEISPLKGLETLSEHINETSQSPLFPHLFNKCFALINTLYAIEQANA